MTSQPITFHKVDQTSRDKVVEWLHKPHVNEFFHGVGLQNTLDDLEAQVVYGNSRFQHWVAVIDGIPFGHLMTSEVAPGDKNDCRFAKHMKPGETAITLDLLIGEESYLGKGLATWMIQALLLEKFQEVTKVFIDPETANTKAVHVYEKAGFRKLEQFIAEWHPVPHWLMMMEMKELFDTPIKKTHIGVYGVVLKNRQILLVRKSRGPYKDLLDLPGGRMEHGEAPSQALVREIREETGVTPKSWALLENTFHVCNYRDESTGRDILFHHRGMVYRVDKYDDSDISFTIHQEDVEGCFWHDISCTDGLSPFAALACRHFSTRAQP